MNRALRHFEDLFGPEFGHGKPFDLGPLHGVLNALGEPQERLPLPIHVAGTNGKGSTIAFMRAIAEAAGLRVHAFTKPHLFRLNERFVVAGKAVDDEVLAAAAERVRTVALQTGRHNGESTSPLSQFDAQAAAAFLLFSETPADITFIEAGMGGRTDSTNVISKPAATVITSIGLDHEDVLGPTVAEIAAHKAGIMRRHVPAIVSRQRDEVREIIEAAAQTSGATLHMQGVTWDAHAIYGRLAVQTEDEILDLPAPTLAGSHQFDNAGLAVAALLFADAPIADSAFGAGVASASWPGRLEALTRGPFSAPIRAKGGEVWVDTGHNAHAAKALARALGDMNAKRKAATIAIIGMRARKDADAFIGALGGAVDHVISVPLTEAHTTPQILVQIAKGLDVEASHAASLAAALQMAAQFPAPRVLICGSFLLAAEALAADRP